MIQRVNSFSFLFRNRNLDSIVQNLAKNFAEGTDYFKMLVDIFASQFRSDRNAHLKSFHVIVPPLVCEKREGEEESERKFRGVGTDSLAYLLMLLAAYRPSTMWST